MDNGSGLARLSPLALSAEKRSRKSTESSSSTSSSFEPQETQQTRDVLPKDWLVETTSIQQAEAAHTRGDIPFGRQNEEWERLEAALEAADELWTFCSPAESWEHHAGRMGVAVVRGGRIVMSLVTIMN
jgi:hypothetical protein